METCKAQHVHALFDHGSPFNTQTLVPPQYNYKFVIVATYFSHFFLPLAIHGEFTIPSTPISL
jgi:hypothetical protein